MPTTLASHPEPNEHVWSWLPLVLATWIPVPGLIPVPAPPDGAPPPIAAPPVAVGHGITSLWVEGDAAVSGASAGPGEPHADLPMLCGDVTPAGSVLTLGAGARVVMIGGDLQLLRLQGPSVHRWTGDELITVAGKPPTPTALPGYREGPLVPLPPIATTAPDDPEPGDVGLAFVAPPATALRDTRPVLRWRWSEPDARFDITLARAADAGSEVVIERWRALSGRSLMLWAPLEPGATYHATVALHGGDRSLARVLSDEVSFSVLDATDAATLAATLAALREAVGQTPGIHPELEVLRARLFESYGLLADAERTWAALALLYPDHPEFNAHAWRLEGEIPGE